MAGKAVNKQDLQDVQHLEEVRESANRKGLTNALTKEEMAYIQAEIKIGLKRSSEQGVNESSQSYHANISSEKSGGRSK